MAYQQRCEIAILTDTTALLHGGVVGLSLRPSKTKGHGTWVIRYVSPVTAKHRNAGLGSYPQIGIAQAGKLGDRVLHSVERWVRSSRGKS